jgi:hypothetical protein
VSWVVGNGGSNIDVGASVHGSGRRQARCEGNADWGF